MPESTTTPDPFAAWREWLSQSERQWNTFLNEAMSTDEFSQGMARMMDTSLDVQKNMNEAMGRHFTSLNVPTRTDVLSLGNRLTEIEERLSAIETAVTTLVPGPARGASAVESAAVPRPPRTRKPATA